MKNLLILALALTAAAGCSLDSTPSSDQKQEVAQERILQQGVAEVGMPAIDGIRWPW